MSPENRAIRDIWDNAADEFERFCTKWPRYKVLTTIGVERIPREGIRRALDVGCGVGDSTITLVRKLSRTAVIEAVDISSRCIYHAKRRCQDENVLFESCDVVEYLTQRRTSLPQIDLIWCSAVIWQIDRLNKFFELARLHVCQGGQIVINWCNRIHWRWVGMVEKSSSEDLAAAGDRMSSELSNILRRTGWVVESVFVATLFESIEEAIDFAKVYREVKSSSGSSDEGDSGSIPRDWVFVVGRADC